MSETQLASPEEYLPLADGSFVTPSGKVVRRAEPQPPAGTIEIPKPSEAVKIVARTKRKLSDLPAPPSGMNVINVVLLYTLYGLSDDEIAIATDLTSDQVRRVRTSDAYSACSRLARDAMIEAEQTTVKDVFVAAAHKAAQKIVTVAASEEGINASKEVLNYAGFAPKDNASDLIRNGGGLVIEVIRKDQRESDITVKLKAGV